MKICICIATIIRLLEKMKMVLESAVNAAVGCAIGVVTDYAFGIDAGDFKSRKADFDLELDYIHSKHTEQIEAMPEIISASQKNYSIKQKIVKNYANTYEISYGMGRTIEVFTPSRIIAWGRKFDPKTGLRQNYAIYENRKIYYY